MPLCDSIMAQAVMAAVGGAPLIRNIPSKASLKAEGPPTAALDEHGLASSDVPRTQN
jgi:hypothetical protein